MRCQKTLLAVALIMCVVAPRAFPAETILFEGFDDSSGFTTGGGNALVWDIAPRTGTSSYPSYFRQGGSQSGDIFYGASADYSTMTIDGLDLTGYTDILLTVSLAAPGGSRWENYQRDSFVISGSTGTIDTFLPTGSASPLGSDVHSTNLSSTFQDFAYAIDDNLTSLTFTFAGTTSTERIGIDSISITGELVQTPAPSALLLGTIGVGCVSWFKRRKRM